MSNPENETRDPLAGMNLSGLEGLGDERDMEADNLSKLEADGKLLLWEADELPPAENQAFSLRLLVNDSGTAVELLEKSSNAAERIATAAERIATALEALGAKAATIADTFGAG